MNISSDEITVNAPVERIFELLGDYNNFRYLMPEQVIRWESDETHGRFTIKDLTELGMRIEDIRPGEYIKLHSDGKVPFDFTLTVFTSVAGPDTSKVYIAFDGNVSPMIAMMARRPLTNLVNHMAGQIAGLVE